MDRLREGKISKVSRFDWKLVETMAESTAWMMAKELGAQNKEVLDKGPTVWRSKLIEAITEAAGDPDVDVAELLKGDTPLGVETETKSRGAFPKCAATEAQRTSAQYPEMRTSDSIDGNYSSFTEHANLAKEEFQKLLAEGHLERLGSW